MTNSHIDPNDVGRTFCDLVMKGGITSGIVFPKLVSRLADQYRFQSIGGTSAGAIAAAGAAAAEFRRASGAADPRYGFEQLDRLADWLGERPDGRHSRLFTLFAPAPATRRHFAILAAMLNRESASTRAVRGVLAAMVRFPIAAIAGALPGVVLLLACRGGAPIDLIAIVVAVLVMAIGAMLATAARAASSLAQVLPKQAFGLSYGHHAGDGAPPALTDWLHGYLQDLASKPASEPLTFGDLDGVTFEESSDVRGIDLQMMTTALSMGRPFSLPFRSEQFYFLPEELARYFPQSVVDWITQHPGPRRPANRARDEAMAAFGYRPFPTRATLPVVVAVRMSLSFPLLLAAVPLYRYAWESNMATDRDDIEVRDASDGDGGEPPDTELTRRPTPDRYSAGGVRRILFSDGGICSNFPVHLFDSVVPAWPTFGVNLRDDLPARANDAERASLPKRGTSLPPEHYAIGDQSGAALVAFAAAIVKTMQNWRDNLQRAAPGFRDRVLTIRHRPGEGGLNLDMASDTIAAMAGSGASGAQTLIDAFARPASVADDHLTYHRWVRARSLLNVLQGVLSEIDAGVTVLDNHPPYPDLIRDAPHYVGASYRLSERARVAAAELLDTLDRLDHDLAEAHVDYGRTAPRPPVELRIQPVL